MRGTLALRPVPASTDAIVVMIVGAIAMLAAVTVVATAKEQRERTFRLLVLYLLYALLEIAVKRLAHFVWFVYPIKFALLGILLLSWAQWRGSRPARQPTAPLGGILGAYLFLATLQVFNPIQGNPVVGILGWLTDFVYVSLYFVAFDLFDEMGTMRRLLRVTALLGVVSAIACFAEQAYGPEDLMKLYPMYVHLVHFTREGWVVYRPSSLSPYIEVFAIAAMLGLMTGRKGNRIWLAIGIGVCVVSTILHAVRIVWATGFATLAMFAILGRRQRVVSLALICASVAVAVNIAMTVTDGTISTSLKSTMQPVQTFEKTRLWGLLALPTIVENYPLGAGVGEASPGVRFIDASDITTFGAHNYLTELAAQMSLAGPILLMIFSIGVISRAWRTVWKAQPDEWRAHVVAGLALVTAVAASFLGGGALVAYPVSDYFWIMCGAILGLQRARRLQAVPPTVVPMRRVLIQRPVRATLEPGAAVSRRQR